MGWESGGHVVVSEMVGPDPLARHTRSGFLADGDWQQRELELIYATSALEVTHLGDWHSHPHGSRRPSSRDQDTAQKTESDDGRTP